MLEKQLPWPSLQMSDVLWLWSVRQLLWVRCDQYSSFGRTSDAVYIDTIRFWAVLFGRSVRCRSTAEFYLSVLQEDGIQWFGIVRTCWCRAHRHRTRSCVSRLCCITWRRSKSSYRRFCRSFDRRASYQHTRSHLVFDILFKMNFYY